MLKLKKVTITGIGQVSSVLTQFIIVLVISSFGGLEEIGLYGLVSSFVIPITTFFLFDISSAVLADENFENNLYNYYNSLLINSFLGFLVIIALVNVLNLPLTLSLSFFFYRTAVNLKEISYSYYQRKNNLEVLSVNQVTIAITTILLFVILFSKVGFYVFFFAGIIICLTIVYDFIRIKPSIGSFINFSFWKEKLVNGLMLGFNAIISSLKRNSPRYFVNFTSQNIELIGVITVYSQIITGLSVLNLIYNRLNLGKVGNHLKRNTQQSIKQVYKIIIRNYLLIISCGALLLLLDSYAIRIVFGREYIDDVILFRLLLLIKAVSFPMVIIKIIYINKNKERFLTLISFISAILISLGILYLHDILYFMIIYLLTEVVVMVIIFFMLKKYMNSAKV